MLGYDRAPTAKEHGLWKASQKVSNRGEDGIMANLGGKQGAGGGHWVFRGRKVLEQHSTHKLGEAGAGSRRKCEHLPLENPPISEQTMLARRGNSHGGGGEVGGGLVLSSSHPLPTATFLLLNLG